MLTEIPSSPLPTTWLAPGRVARASRGVNWVGVEPIVLLEESLIRIPDPALPRTAWPTRRPSRRSCWRRPCSPKCHPGSPAHPSGCPRSDCRPNRSRADGVAGRSGDQDPAIRVAQRQRFVDIGADHVAKDDVAAPRRPPTIETPGPELAEIRLPAPVAVPPIVFAGLPSHVDAVTAVAQRPGACDVGADQVARDQVRSRTFERRCLPSEFPEITLDEPSKAPAARDGDRPPIVEPVLGSGIDHARRSPGWPAGR